MAHRENGGLKLALRAGTMDRRRRLLAALCEDCDAKRPRQNASYTDGSALNASFRQLRGRSDLIQSLEPARRMLVEQYSNLDVPIIEDGPTLLDLIGQTSYAGHLTKLTVDPNVSDGLHVTIPIDPNLANDLQDASIQDVWVAAEKTSNGEVAVHTVDRTNASDANDLLLGSIEEKVAGNSSVVGIAANVADTLRGGGGDDVFVRGGGGGPCRAPTRSTAERVRILLPTRRATLPSMLI